VLLLGTATVSFTLFFSLPLETAFDAIVFLDNLFTSCNVMLLAGAYKRKMYHKSHKAFLGCSCITVELKPNKLLLKKLYIVYISTNAVTFFFCTGKFGNRKVVCCCH
jgi:hypothetical protein